MSVIQNIPSYYPLMIGLIRSQHRNYRVVDIEILQLKQSEYIDALVCSMDEGSKGSYTIYTSSFNYKKKKEFNPDSFVLCRSLIFAAAKDLEEQYK